jgi:hypothetical protein
VNKYGNDYEVSSISIPKDQKAMFRDIKLNFWQFTIGELKKKCQEYNRRFAKQQH